MNSMASLFDLKRKMLKNKEEMKGRLSVKFEMKRKKKKGKKRKKKKMRPKKKR